MAISELRLWKSARSVEQIGATMQRSLTGAEPDLAGYWRFNDGEGTAVTDSGPGGFDGVLTGAAAWSTNAPPVLFPR